MDFEKFKISKWPFGDLKFVDKLWFGGSLYDVKIDVSNVLPQYMIQQMDEHFQCFCLKFNRKFGSNHQVRKIQN